MSLDSDPTPTPDPERLADKLDDANLHAEMHCLSLQFLSLEPDMSVFQRRFEAVNDPQTHPKVLDHIANHGQHYLVKRVADHPGASKETLARLACHEHYEVRSALAGHHSLDLDLQWQLAQDEHPDVRFAVAGSYNLNPVVLAALLEDSNPYVADRARTTLQRLQSGASTTKRLPFKVAEKPSNNHLRASG